MKIQYCINLGNYVTDIICDTCKEAINIVVKQN